VPCFNTDAESASMELVHGEMVDATQANQAIEGCEKHKKCANILYSVRIAT